MQLTGLYHTEPLMRSFSGLLCHHNVITGSGLVWEGPVSLFWGKHTNIESEGPLLLLWTSFVSVSHPPPTGPTHTQSGRGTGTRSLTPPLTFFLFEHLLASLSKPLCLNAGPWNNMCWIKYSCQAGRDNAYIQLGRRFVRAPRVYATERIVSIKFLLF